MRLLVHRLFRRSGADGVLVLPWIANGFPAPAPRVVKNAVIRRYAIPQSDFVETGTFLGDTAAFAAKYHPKVFTIEPQAELATNAQRRFKNSNVTVRQGTSEAVLADVLRDLNGDITFWLDGHWSAGVTFKGEQVTPVIAELAIIESAATQFGKVAVFVDDARLFGGAPGHEPGYPHLSEVLNWARRNGFTFSIQHDIIVMTRD